MTSDVLVIRLLFILVVVFLFWSIFISPVYFTFFCLECYTNFVFTLGSCGYHPASKAFLFSLYNAQGYNPVKLTQYQNQGNAMYSCSTYGPTFGSGHGIYIANDALNNLNSHTRCGYVYSIPSGYSSGYCGFFTGGSHFTPTDIEVFYEKGN